MAWFVEIGPVSYPDSLFASCGRLPYPYADRSRHVWNPDRSRHVWNPSPSLTDDARVRHTCLTDDKGTTFRRAFCNHSVPLVAVSSQKISLLTFDKKPKAPDSVRVRGWIRELGHRTVLAIQTTRNCVLLLSNLYK